MAQNNGSQNKACEIRLSVALVTRNRPDSLERTLQSLRAQTLPPYEVVISDDSGPEFADAARALAAKYGCRYERGPGRGLYANRNHAALACKGTHIRAMDDDHTFDTEHFARCFAALNADPDAVWLVGEYVPADERPGEMPVFAPHLHPRGFSTVPADTRNCWSLADGSTIYPRRLFASGIRFEDGFKFGASYLEYGSLLYHLGCRIRRVPDTYVIHHYIAGARSFANDEMEQGSRFFAMLCHSFLYQPTPRNQALTLAEIGRQLVTRPRLACRALRAGTAAFRRRRTWLRAYRQTAASALPPQGLDRINGPDNPEAATAQAQTPPYVTEAAGEKTLCGTLEGAAK